MLPAPSKDAFAQYTMKYAPDWDIEGRDWPNRATSRFVFAAGFTWHVQVSGSGPVLLLLHGTGAATHSWRALAPALAESFTVVAPDLPGHGFSQLPDGENLSLPFMARALGELLAALGVKPEYAAGHSAGAAVALRMILDRKMTPRAAVSLNGALIPFRGVASILFPALARLLFVNPLATAFFTLRATDPAAVRRLIEGTGSTLDADGLELYGRLFRTRRHVAATLRMMADWDIGPLKDDLSHLPVPLTLVSAAGDRAVPPSVAEEVKALLPAATSILLQNYGHLAHEEAPQEIARIIQRAIRP